MEKLTKWPEGTTIKEMPDGKKKIIFARPTRFNKKEAGRKKITHLDDKSYPSQKGGNVDADIESRRQVAFARAQKKFVRKIKQETRKRRDLEMEQE